MNTMQILRETRNKIATESRWTWGEFARDEYGHGCDFDDDGATCFCIVGAISRVRYDLTREHPKHQPQIQYAADCAMWKIANVIFDSDKDYQNEFGCGMNREFEPEYSFAILTRYNDDCEHDAIISAIDGAIERIQNLE